MSEYRVNLDIFAGPLDLLLYLVRKEEVDIYDIPIAHITEQYIKYVEMLKMLDIDLAGDFLVMAATLMEIKSVMLLPQADIDMSDEEAGDPRAELVRQLLEYKRFKDAANLLGDSADRRKERFTRPDLIIAGLKKQDEPELDIDQISIWTLLEAFDGIMQATGRYASYDHIKDDTPIDLYQIEILHRAQTEGPMTFEKIFQDKTNRMALMGLFLAMLELIRDRLLGAEQPDPLGPIYIRALTDEPAEKAVQDAIYSNVELDEESAEPEKVIEPEEKVVGDDQTVDSVSDMEKSPELQDRLNSEQPNHAPIPIRELPADDSATKAPGSDELAQVHRHDGNDERTEYPASQ